MQLIAQKRNELGKEIKKLRKQRLIPGVMYGKGLDSSPITMDETSFVRIYRQAGETNLVDLTIDGVVSKVLIKEVQLHPVSSSILHVNFHKVNLKEKITTQIPVEIINEDESEFVKSGEGVVLILLNEITIEALPTDLPDAFIVDVLNIKNIGDGITISALDYDRKKVEIVDNDPEDLVVKIDYAGSDVEEETLTEEELIEKLEVTSEAKPEDASEEEADEEK